MYRRTQAYKRCGSRPRVRGRIQYFVCKCVIRERLLIDIHDDLASGTQEGHEALKGLAGMRRMLQHTKAIHFVERLLRTRNVVDVGLYDEHVGFVPVRRIVRLHCIAQVKGYDRGTGRRGLLREATGSTSGLQNEFPMQLGRPSGFPQKPLPGQGNPTLAIVLRPCMAGPLKAEGRRVVVPRNKPRDGADHRIPSRTFLAPERTRLDGGRSTFLRFFRGQVTVASWTAEER